MEELLLYLLHQIATARDLTEVNLAAGEAHERLLSLMEEREEGDPGTTPAEQQAA